MPYLATVASTTFHGLGLVAASKPKSNSATTSILFLVVIVAIGYFLLNPAATPAGAQAQQQKQNVGVGDEVMLSSGIFGRVTGIEGDRASVEIAPDIEIEVVMRAIAQQVATADGVPEPETVSPDPASDEDEDFAHAPMTRVRRRTGGRTADQLPGHHDEPGNGATAWPPTAVKPADDTATPFPAAGPQEAAGGGGRLRYEPSARQGDKLI